MTSIPVIFAVKAFIFIVKVFVYTYEIITWPIYSLFRRHIDYMPLLDPKIEEDYTYNPEEKRTLAMSTRQGDAGAPWRSVEAMDKLVTEIAPGCCTGVEIWLRAVKLYPDSEEFGTREILATTTEPGPCGKQFVKVTLGEYFWETYAQAELRVSRLAAGLDELLKSSRYEKTPIALFSETRAEWIYSCMSIFRLGRPIVTLYATLGDEALVHGLNETEVSTLFISDELLSKIPYVIKNCPKLKLVVYLSNGIFYNISNEKNREGRLHENALKHLQIAHQALKDRADVKLLDIVDVEEMGKGIIATLKEDKGPGLWMPQDEAILPKVDDLAVIMYTSGSTGVPKGVELTHRCLTSAIAGFVRRLPKLHPRKDIFIGYLPLAHVFEMACEFTCLTIGVKIGYGNPQTLTDNSTRIKVGSCKGDVTKLRPTIMGTVPTVLQRIEKTVWEKLTEDGLLAKRLFKFAFDYKLRRLKAGYPSFLVDKIVFRKVRKILGGRIRYIMSGGAPLSESSQMFAYICFAPVVQGYGLTETFSSGCIMETGDMRTKQVGAPVSTVEIVLRPWEEGGYSPKDQPYPRGEVLIGGDPVSRGYFKQPTLTAKDFFVDNHGRKYFCTGDIGQFNLDGSLSIIDRKKDLVKLQAGEYVSLAKVELAIAQSIYVESVCVYASPNYSFTVCFVSPKKKQLRDLALKIQAMPTDEQIQTLMNKENLSEEMALHRLLCNSPKVKEGVLGDIKVMAKEGNLQTFEIPKFVHLDPAIWTPESALVTDALKLKRFNLQKRFQSVIDEMYSKQ